MRDSIVFLVYIVGSIVGIVWAAIGLYRTFKARQRLNQWIKNATKAELLNAHRGKLKFTVVSSGSLFKLYVGIKVQHPDDDSRLIWPQELELFLDKRSCESQDVLTEFVLTTLEDLQCELSNEWSIIGRRCFKRLRSSDFHRARFFVNFSNGISGNLKLELISNQVTFF